MNPETVFVVCNTGVLPFWALLAVAPRWPWTQRLVHALWVPCVLAVGYAWALFSNTPAEGGSFSSLPGVMVLFAQPHAALAGWIHYLAFDLFIGAWEVRDAQRRDIPHVWVLPCLFFTLMAGPLGLLLYLGVRGLRSGEAGLAEA